MGANSKHLATLNLFAFGTIVEYNQNKAKYLELKPPQLRKLELLTVAEIASQKQLVPYSEIMQQLGINDLRQIEDKIIECIYADLLKGKLDQKNQTLHVHSTSGRDIKVTEVDAMIAKLEAWDKQLASAQNYMEEQCRMSQQNVVNDYSEQIMNEVQFQRQVAQVEASFRS